jgi:hypothetical protein
MGKITRRNLVALAAAVPAAAGQQAAPAPAAPADELRAARDQYQSQAGQLAKVMLPMATEPATHFKA